MNRTLKRVLGLSGSVVLGLAGAVAFASGAQAHHPEITGTTECTPDGGWTVVWQVTDWDSDNGSIGHITAVDAELNEGTEIKVDAVLPAFDSGDYLEGSQNLTAEDATASITIAGAWDNGATGERTGTVSAPEGGCTEEPPAEPEPEYEVGGGSDCVGIYVWADNYNPDALAEFTFAPSEGEAITYTPEVDEGFYEYFYVEREEGLAVDIYVGDELVDTIEWYDNELCSYVSVESDCDGLTFTLTVPQDGEETYFEIWTSLSEESITYNLAPGESETVEISGEGQEDLWVNYYVETPKDATGGDIYWSPCDEETPSPSDTPSAQPQLPTTGSSMTIMLGSAAALIVAAAAIFLIMRRRRAAQDW
jgi:LPXTG-motif cell wall-anchored protein